jgi:Ca2+-binding EF-hand superfamily protein
MKLSGMGNRNKMEAANREEPSMLQRTKILWSTALAVLLIAAGVMIRTAAGQATASVPKPQDKLTIGQNEVKQLLLLMDTDKNGKISKDEFMKFMAAEFDRLDKDKSGELDVTELAQSKIRVSHSFTAAGK